MPTLADWGHAFAELRARYDGSSGPLPPGCDRSEALYAGLVATQETSSSSTATCTTGTSCAPGASRGWRSTRTVSWVTAFEVKSVDATL
jgi:hypothetical protein